MKLLITTKRALVLLALLLALMVASASSAAAQGLTVQNGTIYNNGQPYHAAGVTWFDLFQWHITSKDSTYRSGLQALAKHNIHLARFAASAGIQGGTPISVWQSSPQRWWSAMDAVFSEAAKDGVELIADLDWSPDSFPQLVGEPDSALADPTSRSSQLLAQYIAQFVQRYKSSPALAAYEDGSEFNLYADTGQAPYLSSTQVHDMLVNENADIQANDGSRLIESGDSDDRPQAYNLAHGNGWVTDTCCAPGSQWAQMEDYYNPSGDYSTHIYNPTGNWSSLDTLSQLNSLGSSESKPVIVSEYGWQNASTDHPTFQQILDGVAQSPISALWTYNTKIINNYSWSATFTNSLAFELQAIAAKNP